MQNWARLKTRHSASCSRLYVTFNSINNGQLCNDIVNYLCALLLTKWEIAFGAAKYLTGGHILQTHVALETTRSASLFWSCDNGLFSKNNFSRLQVLTRKQAAAGPIIIPRYTTTKATRFLYTLPSIFVVANDVVRFALALVNGPMFLLVILGTINHLAASAAHLRSFWTA